MSDRMADYLQQQSESVGPRRVEQALVHAPDNQALEEFKQHVKVWIELDNQVKKLQSLIKEKKAVQKMLTEKILAFMSHYNIEDLNTKDGKLRYKVVQVKPSVRQGTIKQKIKDFFSEDQHMAEKVMHAVFESNSVVPVQKPQLKRLKGVNIMSV